MSKSDLRGEARVPVSRRGTLSVGDVTFPCMVMDMSSGGLLLVSSRPLTVGQILGFKCELYPNTVLECKVEIRHTDDEGAGAKIVEIDEKGLRLCQVYLQEHYSGKLTRSR